MDHFQKWKVASIMSESPEAHASKTLAIVWGEWPSGLRRCD